MAAALRAIPVRQQVHDVIDDGVAFGFPPEVIQALVQLAAVAPVAPLVGDGYDLDALDEVDGLPGLAELFNLRMRMDAGDPEVAADAQAMAEQITPERVAALAELVSGTSTPQRSGAAEEPSSIKKPSRPRLTRGDVASRAAKQERSARLREESLALGIPVKAHGKFLTLDEIQANIEAKLREESQTRGLPVHDSFSGTFLPMDVLKANIKDHKAMYGEVSGEGVRRMRGRGIASIDEKIALGRYNINTRKLENGIVQLRSARGGAVHKFPTTTVSDNVRAALHKIIAGGDLSYDDISGLSEDERRYLHTVSTQCGIKTNIPQPKDAVAAQADRYVVLKGEILASNDNPELVREFKTLILKMSASGLLPKGQVREVLLDLVALGK
jgi:hypothetical protein